MTALYLILMTVIGTYGSYITWFNYNSTKLNLLIQNGLCMVI